MDHLRISAPTLRLQSGYTAATKPVTSGNLAVSATNSNNPAAGLVALWIESQTLKDYLNGALPVESPEFMDGMARLVDLQDLIAATPAATAQEWAAKILNADDTGSIESCGRWADMLLAEARQLLKAAAWTPEIPPEE